MKCSGFSMLQQSMAIAVEVAVSHLQDPEEGQEHAGRDRRSVEGQLQHVDLLAQHLPGK